MNEDQKLKADVMKYFGIHPPPPPEPPEPELYSELAAKRALEAFNWAMAKAGTMGNIIGDK